MLVPTKRIELQDGKAIPRRRVVVVGSTGSIGRAALQIIENNPDRFELYGIVAGSNVDLLRQQILHYQPRFAALVNVPRFATDLETDRTELLIGEDSICDLVAEAEVDVVLAAAVGFAGLRSTLAALKAGKQVALANKESLVAAGRLVSEVMAHSKALLVPVDSEHSAIYQALQGERFGDVSKLIITGSGGPFLRTPLSDWPFLSPAQAVKHPVWRMGSKISIDSATLMNKALEVIEAHWLFGLPPEQIEVLIHPQSIVHSLVEFCDGMQIAQLSRPDMKGAISYALQYPYGRVPETVQQLDLAKLGNLTFEALDNKRFGAVDLARAAIRSGGAAAAVLSSANEAAVDGFMDGSLRFDQLVPTVNRALERYGSINYSGLEDLIAIDRQVREWVASQYNERGESSRPGVSL